MLAKPSSLDHKPHALQQRALTKRLQSLVAQRRKLQRGLTRTLFTSGATITTVGLGLDFVTEAGLLGEKKTALVFQLIWSVGFPLMFLSVLPTYRRAIYHTALFSLLMVSAAAVTAVALSFEHINALANSVSVEQQLTSLRDTIVWSVMFLPITSSVSIMLLRILWSFHAKRDFPPRVAMIRMWFAYRLSAVGFSLITLTTLLINYHMIMPFCLRRRGGALPPSSINSTLETLHNASSDACGSVLGDQPPETLMWVAVTLWMLQAVLLTPANRGHVIASLASLIDSSELSSAATIASMLPNAQDPSVIIATATEKFKALPFEALSLSDLVSNVDTGLEERTVPAALGQVSAFVSHSWRDPPKGKWAALSWWAAQYGDGGQDMCGPTLWLDKACIDQSDIEGSLLCLPVFLASCKSLLVLAGPTYESRLCAWISELSLLRPWRPDRSPAQRIEGRTLARISLSQGASSNCTPSSAFGLERVPWRVRVAVGPLPQAQALRAPP
jgi:hypothetical protein